MKNISKNTVQKNKTKNDPGGGSSSKLTETEIKELEKHLSNTTYLKVKSIIAYVRQTYGKHYSPSGMTEWLIKQGFTFKKPEKVPGKFDPKKQEQFIEEYYRLKSSLGAYDSLYFLDAVHPEYQSQAVCGWIKKGDCKTLQTTGKQKRLHFIGVLAIDEMQIMVRKYKTIKAATTLNISLIIFAPGSATVRSFSWGRDNLSLFSSDHLLNQKRAI